MPSTCKNINKYVTSSSQIELYRHKFFYEFITPSLLKVSEEITLLNTGEDTTNVSLEYPLANYLSYLNIYDSNGCKLEYFQKNDDGNDKYPKNIVINLSRDKIFFKNDYRTIKLEYTGNVTDIKLLAVEIDVTLLSNVSIHLYIQECNHYELDLNYSIMDENDNKIEKKEIYIRTENRFFELYSSAVQSNNEKILIRIEHKIPNSILNWYKLGLAFSGIISVLIPLLYHFNAGSINVYIAIDSITMSVLIVIKGWINQKEVIRLLGFYDKLYWFCAILIIIEIFLLVTHYYLLLPRGYDATFMINSINNLIFIRLFV